MARRKAKKKRTRSANSGTYLLWIEVEQPLRFGAGALGELALEPGTYLYVGSARRALGARVRRHLTRAAGRPHVPVVLDGWTLASLGPLRPKRLHWHVDHLLEQSAARVREVTLLVGRHCECRLAGDLRREAGATVPLLGFGASDCRKRCGSHLLRLPRDHGGQARRVLRDLQRPARRGSG
jgi:Uri superfamily endonuclease